MRSVAARLTPSTRSPPRPAAIATAPTAPACTSVNKSSSSARRFSGWMIAFLFRPILRSHHEAKTGIVDYASASSAVRKSTSARTLPSRAFLGS